MIGVKFHPDMHQCAVDDAKYKPAWEFANEHHLPLLSHTSAGSHYNPVKAFEKLADMYPNVSVLIGHSGFGSIGADHTIEVAKKCPNVYADITGSTATYGILERMVGELGADRVLLGTDLPFIDPRSQIGRVAFAKISDDEKRQILGLNASRIFGINV
jgi:predicted TIM-barrel fold metal-dependent hydrolase